MFNVFLTIMFWIYGIFEVGVESLMATGQADHLSTHLGTTLSYWFGCSLYGLLCHIISFPPY